MPAAGRDEVLDRSSRLGQLAHPHERLRQLGLTLPPAPAPAASYVQTRLVPLSEEHALLFVAGQVPRENGALLTGRCPDEVSLEEAMRRARVCGLSVLAQIEAAVGLDRIEQLTQVTGFVLSDPAFGDQPKVLNGASDLFVEVLGEAGRHTRVALGASALPFSVTVEIQAVAVVRTD